MMRLRDLSIIPRVGCIFCGHRIWPWQKMRHAPIGKACVVCHSRCYDRRFLSYVERHDN